MRKHIHSARDLILPFVDFFYRFFRRMMPLQTFRYLACGAANTLVGLAVYSITFTWLLKEKNFDLDFYALKPHVAALFFSFCISFPLGFFLMKYVVFSDSKIKGRIQLFRYFMIYLFNLMMNYILLKILVEYFHVHAVVAQVMTIFVIVSFSYLAQRHFSFRRTPDEEEETEGQ